MLTFAETNLCTNFVSLSVVEVTNTDGMRQSGTHNVARMPGGSHNEAYGGEFTGNTFCDTGLNAGSSQT